MTIEIKEVHIARKHPFNNDKGPFVCKVKSGFSYNDTMLEIEVDEARTLSIIEIIADSLEAACSHELSKFKQLAREANGPLLEHKPEEPTSADALDDDVPF